MNARGRGLSLLVCSTLVLGAATALAQGTTSGSINGTVTDNTGAVLPGVTVTATSPVLMGVQDARTNEQGQYRFPSLTPGEYRLTYELPGFTRLSRESIRVSLGFASEVNVQLSLASVQESVTVTGASPVIDTQNTNIQNNFTSEMLKSIPNARDIWSLIAEAPGMMVTRFDVGGSRAGTQTGYSAYGRSGQNRVQIDGVNTTEGTGAAGFYYDYGAFDEVSLGAASNDASMPTPGVQVNTVLKSGGNDLKGDVYFDYENENLQSRNVDDRQRRLGVGEGTRITKYLDPNFNIGGPIERDKLWYFGSFRSQEIKTTITGWPVEAPGVDVPDFLTRLQNLTYKISYQLNANNKLSHYIQWGFKYQPYRDSSTTRSRDAILNQESASWAGNVEWNSIVSPTFFHNLRFSTFGYNFPLEPYGVNLVVGEDLRRRRWDRASDNQAGGGFFSRLDRRRYQGEWVGTLYRDGWLGGNHAVRISALSEWETGEDENVGYKDRLRLQFNTTNTALPDFSTPNRIQIYNHPTTGTDNLWHHGAYVHDQITVGPRVTVNVGLRWDYYNAYQPEQTLREGPFTGFFYRGQPLSNGYSIPAAAFSGSTVPAQGGLLIYKKAFGPRAGLAWDVTGDGRNVLKASWGRFYSNPGVSVTDDVNPLQDTSYTFNWIDRNGDRDFQMDEFGTFVSSSGGVENTIDPGIGHPNTDDLSIFFERQIVTDLGARVGFVYKKANDEWELIEQARVGALFSPIAAYDPGPDGIRGNEDDRGDFTAYDILGPLPASVEEWQTPGDFDETWKNIDLTINKRMSNRWSLVSSFLYTWNDELLFNHAENPNEAHNNLARNTLWAFKLIGTYQAPWGVNVSPVVRHQSGDNLSRRVRLTLRSGQFDFAVEPNGAYRQDHITLFDTRVEKQFRAGGDRRLGLFFDAFNILNRNSAEAQDNITGRRTAVVGGERIPYARFFRPTQVLAPRIFRLGVKLAF